ncbi:MAG: DUF6588 family protein [Bacteroidota bacterium]
MKRFLHLIVVLAICIPSSFVFSQTQEEDEGLEETMGKLAQDAARAYISPVVSGFGADMNSGWFHRAPWATMFGFDLEFGLVIMGAAMEDNHRRFTSDGSFRFNYDQADQLAAQAENQGSETRDAIRDAIMNQDFGVNFSGPTIVGSKTDSLRIAFPGKQINVNGTNYLLGSSSYTLPVTGLLENAKFVPLASPQLTIGTILGSQFTFRYLPEFEIDPSIGKFKYFGFGIQHNPLVWFGGEDALPFELSAGYFTQNLKIGTLMDASATSFGVNTSIRLGWGFLNLTPYAGFMIEKSKIIWAYEYSIETSPGVQTPQRITFEAEGENSSRFVLGASIKILLINVNVDMNFAKYKTLSAGVMIVI